MDIIKDRIILISSVTLLVLTLFALTGKSAYADVLFIGDRGGAGVVQEEALAGESSEPEELDQFLDALIEEEETIDEEQGVKAQNPVAVLSSAVRGKLKSVGAITDLSLRNIFNAASSSDSQWPFAIAGLLFILLMMRLKRRTRKSKF